MGSILKFTRHPITRVLLSWVQMYLLTWSAFHPASNAWLSALLIFLAIIEGNTAAERWREAQYIRVYGNKPKLSQLFPRDSYTAQVLRDAEERK